MPPIAEAGIAMVAVALLAGLFRVGMSDYRNPLVFTLGALIAALSVAFPFLTPAPVWEAVLWELLLWVFAALFLTAWTASRPWEGDE